jgi:hypothetical protein
MGKSRNQMRTFLKFLLLLKRRQQEMNHSWSRAGNINTTQSCRELRKRLLVDIWVYTFFWKMIISKCEFSKWLHINLSVIIKHLNAFTVGNSYYKTDQQVRTNCWTLARLSNLIPEWKLGLTSCLLHLKPVVTGLWCDNTALLQALCLMLTQSDDT